MNWFAWIITACAGGVLPVQGAVNARLGRDFGSSLLAVFSSFATGTAALVLYMLIARVDVPRVAELAKIPAWTWTGGILGCFYVGAIIWSVPKIGTGTAFALAICGQVIVSVLLDHFGLMGLRQHPASATRMAGVVLLLVGVILVQRG